MSKQKSESELLSEILFVLKRMEQRIILERHDDPLYFLEDLPEDPAPSALWEGSLQAFLEAHQMKVLHVNALRQEDWVTEPIAVEMGRNWRTISPVLGRLKRALNGNQSLRMEVANRPGTERVLRAWLKALAQIAFIEGYAVKEYGEKLRLVVDPARHSDAINFLTGGWLEQFALAVVRNALKHAGRLDSSEMLTGVQVELPNGDPAELDLLLKVNSRVFWIEAKTGAYQKHLPKYSRFADMLGLDEDHAFLILADSSAQTSEDIELLYGIHVLPIHLFENQFLPILSAAWNGPAQ